MASPHKKPRITVTLVGTIAGCICAFIAAYGFLAPKADASKTKPGIKQKSKGDRSPNFAGNVKVGRDMNFGDTFNAPPPGATFPKGTPKAGQMLIVGGWEPVERPTLKVGDRVRIHATGKVQWGFLNQTAGPEGVPIGMYPYTKSPVDDPQKVGALIGKFGNGKPFIIGTDKELWVKPGGLFLATNDAYPANNSQGFTVSIKRLN